MNAVVEFKPQGGALTAHTPGHRALAEILEHVKTVQEVMKAVMRPDVHYGVIPGTDKPSLLKAGAELLCMVFRIADTYQVEDLSTADTVRYRVTCVGSHQMTGTVLGTGMGEASSGEEKYKWIKASRTEWEAAPETLRRKKHGWNKKERREFEILQVRTEPANLANTVLKMANKRAKLAMVLNVTAASDMFTQDLEDMEDRLREHLSDGGDEGEQAAQQQPAQQHAQQPAGPAAWPDDSLEKRFDQWRQHLSKGKTHDDIIAFAQTKGALSEAQIAKIRALKPAAEAAQPAGQKVTDVEPKLTYAALADKLTHAMALSDLDVAEDLIGSVDDAQQRSDLVALAKDRRTYLEERAL